MDTNTKIGIVILNYNAFESVMKCVYSIFKYEKKRKYNIYIIDNASTDGSMKRLRTQYSFFSNVKIIDAKVNGGYSYGNNCGIGEAKKDGVKFVVIANPDTYLVNDAISKLIDFLENNENVSVAGPKLRQPDGQKQFARKKVTFWRAIFCKLPFRYINIVPATLRRTIDWEGKGNFIFDGMVAGCFFAARIEDFNTTGLFDDDFFLYYEEDVIAYNLNEIKKKAAIVPGAKVFHDHSTTTKKEGMAFIYFYYRISEFLLLCKYAKLNNFEKKIISFMNLGWFYLYAFRRKDAKSYLKKLKRIYHYIYHGNYSKANEVLYIHRKRLRVVKP